MTSFNKIGYLIDPLYKGYGKNGKSGRLFFLPYLNKLRNYNCTELICYCVKNYPASFTLALLLSLPELWESLNRDDWLYILKKNSPRRDPIVIDLDDGEFSDALFLLKFLRINLINWYIDQDDISELDKLYFLRFCKRKGEGIFLDEYDVEDLDGDFYMLYNDLNKHNQRLLTGETEGLTVMDDYSSFKNAVLSKYPN